MTQTRCAAGLVTRQNSTGISNRHLPSASHAFKHFELSNFFGQTSKHTNALTHDQERLCHPHALPNPKSSATAFSATHTHTSKFANPKIIKSRSQWPSGLRLGFAADRLLGLRVRIPPAAWVSVVSVVCCGVEVSATG